MSDRTPADVIARTLMCDLDCCQGEDPEASDYRDAEAVIAALAAAGFRVVPIPDDDTRALATQLREQADVVIEQNMPATAQVMYAAAALLDGQPQDRPDRCPTCGSGRPHRLAVYDEQGVEVGRCTDTWPGHAHD